MKCCAQEVLFPWRQMVRRNLIDGQRPLLMICYSVAPHQGSFVGREDVTHHLVRIREGGVQHYASQCLTIHPPAFIIEFNNTCPCNYYCD